MRARYHGTSQLAFSPDSQYLAASLPSGEGYGDVYVWNTKTNMHVAKFRVAGTPKEGEQGLSNFPVHHQNTRVARNRVFALWHSEAHWQGTICPWALTFSPLFFTRRAVSRLCFGSDLACCPAYRDQRTHRVPAAFFPKTHTRSCFFTVWTVSRCW